MNPIHLQVLQTDMNGRAMEADNSDRTFFIQLLLWTTANGISMIFTWALIIAIARSPKARSLSFNVYLVFSILPDAYKNTSGFVSNLANLLLVNGSDACTVIGWNDAYWWCANLWMACVVFWRLHEMLAAGKMARRHEPPTISRVIKESVAVHTFSVVMASFTLIPVNWIPKATSVSGCEAYPEKGNTGQLIFYWAFFMPVTSLIPTLWVTALCFNIWWRSLLPVNGSTRTLLFYFARLLSVIYIVTIAVMISFFFGGWVQAIAFVVFNMVGFLSVCLALLKRDVMKCWKQMWKCQSPDEVATPNDHANNENDDLENGFFTIMRKSIRKIMQSFRHGAGSLPVNFNWDKDDSNNHRVVKFRDDNQDPDT